MGTRYSLGARARNRDGKLDAIRDIPLFSAITDADATSIARLTELVALTTGRVVSSSGEPCREFVMVVYGRLAASRPQGPITPLRPGDHVGAAEIIDAAPSPVTVRATTDSTALIASRNQ